MNMNVFTNVMRPVYCSLFRLKKQPAIVAIIWMLSSLTVSAQVNMTSTSSYFQNFNTLITSGSGTWTDNSTIPNWYSQRTGTANTIAADAGTSTTGNLFSYGTGTNTDRALGTIGSGNAAAGSFAHGVLLRNTSSSSITDIRVTYTLEQWRNGGNTTAQPITFWYKISASPITALTPTNPSGWTQVTGLTLNSPVNTATAASLNGNTNSVIATNVSIPSLSLPVNSYIMLKWEDIDHPSSDHGLAIDSVTIAWTAVSCTPPSISAISNSGPVCDTTSLQLNVTAAGSATLTYSWTGPSGFTSSTEDPLVATPHSGYYVVTVSNGCGSPAKDSTLAVVNVSSSWYADGDVDGYGAGAAIVACVQPSGRVNNNTDCNDGNNAIHPGAAEICNTLDDDCDGFTDDADPGITGQSTFYADGDGDSYGAGSPILACTQPGGTSVNNTDCNDGNNAVNPGASEVCGNSIDDNCNTSIDEGCGTFTYYYDADADGFGRADSFIVSGSGTPPAGYSSNSTDCNDNNNAVNPSAQEICNSIDDDCDGFTDNADPSVIGQTTYYADTDDDTYGAGAPILSCTAPAHSSLNNTDCNNNNAAVNPGATEICNSIDDDCDSFIDNADPSVTGQPSWYVDGDTDGYGAGAATLSCTQPSGQVANNTDCNDGNNAVHPGATEICNGIDDDCDGFTDDVDPSITGQGSYYADADGDGYGAGSVIHACVQPASTSLNNTDCNDALASVHPGASEISGNSIDDDCDGIVDELNVGDIMVIGGHFDATDQIAFVTWVNLPVGTTIRFTDNSWNGTVLASNENTAVWTTASAIPAGTVIVGTFPSSGSAVWDAGTSTSTLNGLSADGEAILAYQGLPASPSFVFGLNMDGGWQTTGAVNNNSSYLPSALNVPNGNFALLTEFDNSQYNGARAGFTTAQFKALILNSANWQSDDAGTLFPTLNSTDFFDINYLSTGVVNGSYCVTSTDNTPISIPYTTTITFGGGNIFTAQLSDASGSFASPVVLGTVAATASGTINGFIPSSVAAGTGYRIRVVASNPAGPGTDNGSNITINKVTASASTNSPICAGQQLNLLASGGTIYSWSGPNGFTSSAQNPSIAVALQSDSGYYSVIVTNAAGCSDTVTVHAVINDCGCFPPNISAAVDSVTCFGLSTGNINLTITGIATPPYTFAWSNGASTEDLSSLPAGIYTVTVTDNLSCSASLTINVYQPAQLQVNVTTQNPICYGAATGIVDATPSGGTTPYIYSWSNGATTQDLTNVVAGTYNLLLTDQHGCTATAGATITQPSEVTITLDGAFTLTCDSNSLGNINISVSNDTLTNPNNPGLLISEVGANPTGTDSPFEWVELIATKKINFSVTPFTVIVANNGTASTKGWVTGTPPASSTGTYAFEITSGIVNPGDVVYVGGSSMAPTGVKLRVINTSTSFGDGGIGSPNSTGVIGNGGGNADGVAVFNHAVAAIDSNTVPVDAILFGTGIGGSAVTVDGFYYGYTLPSNDKYTGGHITPTSYIAPDVPNGIYIKATGAYNASSGSYSTPRVWTASSSFTTSTSSISVTSSNTYLWSNGSTDQDLTGVMPGTYAVSVTTNIGCVINDTFTLAIPVLPQPYITPGDSVVCNGTEIFLKVSDQGSFSSGYPQGSTVEWLGIAAGLSVNDSVSSVYGPYFVAQVSIPGGCVGTSDTVVVETKSIGVIPVVTNASCGSTNGKIVITVTGGVAPYRYVWTQGVTTVRDIVSNSIKDSIYNLAAGNYDVIVYDNYGNVVVGEPLCSSGIVSFSVITQGGVQAFISSYTNVTCNGMGDGTATADGTSGTLPYTFEWNTGSTSNTISALNGGLYIVTVTDANGCSDTASVNIIDPAVIEITFSTTDVSVCGGNDGSATAIVTGGTPGFTYQWYDSVLTEIGTLSDIPTISNLYAGLYYVVVTDTNNCNNFATVTINQNCGDQVILNLRALLAGFYNDENFTGLPGTMSAKLAFTDPTFTTPGNLVDTLRIELRDPMAVLNPAIETAYAVVDTGGYGEFTFSSAVNGGTYWIAVFHNNSLQTWSAAPITFASVNTYDFTTSDAMAYDDGFDVNPPMCIMPTGQWGLWSGDFVGFDPTQDEFIDLFDQIALDNDIVAFASLQISGYLPSDLNGDGFVDLLDQIILDNNIGLILYSPHPTAP